MKCAICDNEATVRFSPDLDIDGIPACELHKDQVRFDLIMMSFRDEKTIKRLNKKYGKDRTVDLEKRSRKRSK